MLLHSPKTQAAPNEEGRLVLRVCVGRAQAARRKVRHVVEALVARVHQERLNLRAVALRAVVRLVLLRALVLRAVVLLAVRLVLLLRQLVLRAVLRTAVLRAVRRLAEALAVARFVERFQAFAFRPQDFFARLVLLEVRRRVFVAMLGSLGVEVGLPCPAGRVRADRQTLPVWDSHITVLAETLDRRQGGAG